MGTPVSGEGGLRRRRTHFFVQIPRETIRDRRLSFRARGVLAYLLDQPEGWDVRSESIAGEGSEGREAIRTALRELGRYGYYRLERRRDSKGHTFMGTSISEEPVQSWAEEFAEFGEKAVPVIAQPDGTYLVKHLDGSLSSDGFEVQGATQAVSADEVAEPPVPTGDGFPGAGFPDAGSPGSGFLGAFRERETGEGEGRVNTLSADSVAGSEPQERRTTRIVNGATALDPVLLVEEPQLRLLDEIAADPEATFEDFWAAWPRRTAKEAARKAWTKAIRHAKPSVIVAAAADLSEHRLCPKPSDPRVKWVPHPASWLNDERWEDEYPIWRQWEDEEADQVARGPRRPEGGSNRVVDPTSANEDWLSAFGGDQK